MNIDVVTASGAGFIMGGSGAIRIMNQNAIAVLICSASALPGAGILVSTPKRPSNPRQLWKLIPGIAVSAFFLWRTLRVIPFEVIRSVRLVAPLWLLIAVVALVAGYTLRVYRWWFMLRRDDGPSFATCARVLLTSFAANNILPFRIGDFLRVFAYADDLRAASSTVLSTVILERLLDICMLLLFLVACLLGAGAIPPVVVGGRSLSILAFAAPVLTLCVAGVLLLLFGARPLQGVLLKLVSRFHPGPRIEKLERWTLLLFDAVLKLSIIKRLYLIVMTVVVWVSEGTIFVALAHAMGVFSRVRGPWLALSLSNLSYLIPSSPGAIGTFEYFAKLGMVSQGAPQAESALYGLVVHVFVLLTVTVAGGIAFLVHRMHRGRLSRPLSAELHDLPTEMPQ